jgi:imidazolonepropionase-like amidohydrolase
MMKMKLAILAGLLICFSLSSAEDQTIAITNGKVFTMTGPVLEKATIVIQNGIITDVGPSVAAPAGARVIDAAGKIVVPGLIDGNCRVGLDEVSLVASTVDSSEDTNPITPQMRVVDGFFPESKTIGVTRSNGITAGIVSPLDENVLTGMSAFIEFSGGRIDQVVLKSPTAVHATLGEAPKETYGERDKMPSTRMGTAALLRDSLQKAKEYGAKWDNFKSGRQTKNDEKDSTPERKPEYEALLEVLKGNIPLVVSAHRVDDILTAIRIAGEFNIKQNLVINHGTDAYKVASILAREKIPVIVGPVTTQPDRMETLGARYDNAALLQRAGVLIAIQTNDAQNARNLPYEAGLAVANGLPYEEALKAITINPAKIFKVDSQVGSIEKGKRANLIVAGGDPLEPKTEILHVLIGGREIPPENYHRQLWEEFQKQQQ